MDIRLTVEFVMMSPQRLEPGSIMQQDQQALYLNVSGIHLAGPYKTKFSDQMEVLTETFLRPQNAWTKRTDQLYKAYC